MPASWLTTAKNWVHDGTVVVAGLAFVFALVVVAVHTLDSAVQASLAPWMALVSGILIIASKGIDSVYAWMVAHATGGAIVPGVTPPLGQVIDVPAPAPVSTAIPGP